MKIEILTRQMDKKADLLTFLAKERDFNAIGDIVRAEGAELELGADYMLFTTRRVELADRVVKTLFTVRPVPFAPAFYELVTDQKILITASSRPINRIIPGLNKLEHIDLERGELAGLFEPSWQSRDVAVMAWCEIMVQGGLAVARVKFAGHFRESEWHCRACLEKVALNRLLEVFTGEAGAAPPGPDVSEAVAEGHSVAGPEAYSSFINRCPREVVYRAEDETFMVLLGGEAGRIEFKRQANAKNIDVFLQVEDPASIDPGVITPALELLNIKSLRISGKVSRLLLSPQVLVQKLGFTKADDFFLFVYTGDNMEARYNIRDRELVVLSVLQDGQFNIENMLDRFSGINKFYSLVTANAA
ncbi:MAG: hypothetical protein VR69_09860 [Peptococcaceae bacterium BRH_c4b]|nr:MAG: hypothetical protein VR69_09860 [Peptococcaceae bacterium BRH_c4b]